MTGEVPILVLEMDIATNHVVMVSTPRAAMGLSVFSFTILQNG